MPLCLSGNRSVSVGEGRILLHPIRLPKDRVSRGSELAGRDGQQDHTQKNWRNKADVGGSWKWKAKGSVAQSCPTLCNPMDQGLLPIQFSRQEYWVGIHSFSRGSSHPGIEPASPASQAGSLLSEPPGKPRKIMAGGGGGVGWCHQINIWKFVTCYRLSP